MKSVIPILLSAFVFVTHGLTYDDLENTGISCPDRHSCEDRDEDDSHETHCKCDSACASYKDCCIDAYRSRDSRRKPARNNRKCQEVGNYEDTGVYVISDCSSRWEGPEEVRERCVEPTDFRDPLSAPPVASQRNRKTVVYRNSFCAECNDANMDSLTVFPIRLKCGSSGGLSEDKFLSELTYNEELGSWGVQINWPKPEGDDDGTYFLGCEINFDVPEHLNETMRFCRPNITSHCAPDWTSRRGKKSCDEYMAVVYDGNGTAFRNPHCAICNHRTVDDLTCFKPGFTPYGVNLSLVHVLDVNPSGGNKVGKQQCPSGQIYDPFVHKKCISYIPGCSFQGYKKVNGKCVYIGT